MAENGDEFRLPFNVILTCIKPMYAPIIPGIFSRENDRYGATICVDDTCHAEPKRVTTIYTNKKLYSDWN